MHWMDIENHDFTEAGEPELAHDIDGRGQQAVRGNRRRAAAARITTRNSTSCMRGSNDLIAMNKAAMFRADSRAAELGKQLTYEFAGGLRWSCW